MHWDTFKLDNYIIVGGDGMGDVGLARYEPVLDNIFPVPDLKGFNKSYSNCQRSTHSISKWIFKKLAL